MQWLRRASALVLFMAIPATCWAQVARVKRPKLVVTLVVDQFRADQLSRFQSRFLPALGARGEPGGFRYLMERGAYYPLAEYGLLQNMTGPGHATILSGAYAYQHGIPVNTWYDQTTQKSLYCVEDPNFPLIGLPSASTKRGVSPKNFHGTTIGDELKNSGYRSRVVTVAMKDRSAVLLGGYRADLALWFDLEAQGWTSSRFYLPDGQLPAWVKDLNARLDKTRPETVVWKAPEGAGSGTSLSDNHLAMPSAASAGMGLQFPHSSPGKSREATYFPEGTMWTVDAAITALESLKLGQGPDSDLLAVSFSNHDFVSHFFGPNSRELEELTVVEDREIARLLAAVKKAVGLDQSIIVLTADHGGMPSAEWLRANRVEAGRVDPEALQKQGEAFLVKTYGAPRQGSWLPMVMDFNFYLNRTLLKEQKLDRDEVVTRLSRFFKEEATGMEGVAQIFNSKDVRSKTLPAGMFQQQILRTYNEDRSGDVIMILKPNFVPPGSTADHMSSYAYDRTVPLLLAGPQIKAGVYGQKAEVVDIAPTLAFFLGTTPPTGSEGRVLSEVLRDESPKK